VSDPPREAAKASSIGRNIIWSYGGQAGSLLSSVVIAAVAFRSLGAPGFGVYALVVSVTNLLGTANFGLNAAVVQATSRDDPAFEEESRKQARRDVEVAHAAYVVLGGVALVGTAVILLVVTHMNVNPHARGDYLPAMVLLLGAATAATLGTSAFAGIPVGRRRFAVNMVSTLAGSAVNVLVVITMLGTIRAAALGAGQLASIVASRLVNYVWLRREEPWFRIVPPRARRVELRRVAVFALPLLVISVGGQVIATTDLLVVGAVASASAVALYRIGSLAPNQASIVLFTGVDTGFPVLAATPDPAEQERTARFLSRLACFSAGVVYGAMMLFRADVLRILSGHSSALGENVLLVFAGVWLVNVPVHCIALLLIARGRQRAFAPLVAGEVIANVALTVVLAIVIGPLGAAIATLVTIFLSNQLLLPRILRGELVSASPRVVSAEGVLWLVGGVLMAACGASGFLFLQAGVLRLALGTVAACVAGAIGGGLVLRSGGRAELVALLKRRGAGMLSPPSEALREVGL
jgi:O-antigen/teichoic acid export membrane protein